MFKKLICEFMGTAVLVFVACGAAVLVSSNYLAIAFAFGLVIVAMAFSIGDVSGCHINPAVSFGFYMSGRMSGKDFALYALAQIVGGFLGATLLGLVLGSFSQLGGNEVANNITKYYENTPALFVGVLVEIVLTFIFVFTILSVTANAENKKVAGIVIGLTLTLVHIVGIGLTGTSVNPARSIGPSVLQLIGGEKTSFYQIWIWIIGPMVGGGLAALMHRFVSVPKVKE